MTQHLHHKRTAGCYRCELGRDEMTADLSPDEAATLARFEAAPDAEESLRERVARAIYEADGGSGEWWDLARPRWCGLADAAIAVMRGES